MLNLRNLPFPSLKLLFVALIFAAVATAGQSISSDKFALLRFKSFITEDPLGFLSDWNPNDKDPCSWNGVTCDGLSGRVIALQLSGNLNCSVSVTSGNPNSNHSRISFACLGFLSSEFELSETNSSKLKGKLSPTIGDLTELRVLSLGFNDFFGIVPFEIGKLRFLEVLDLGFNGFEGEIPGSIANCVQLQEVSFAGNRLNGTIPVFLAGFRNLRLVSLSFNLFKGPVPEEFGENCRVLEHLHLAGNFLSGAIPSNLGNCTRLRSLILYSNMLVNEIPSNLGELKMLEALDLSRNFLSGVLPSELGNCEQLKVLVLKNGFVPWLLRNNSSSSLNTEDFNFFEGEIPDNVVRLPNLRVLWAPNLNLEGTLPQNWSSCSNLQMVNLAQNYFVGEIPASLGNCKSLYFLKLSSNNLTGMLPEEISLPCMVVFNVSGNLLSGDIPRFSHNGCSGMPINLSQLQLDLPGVYSSFFYSSSLLSTFFSLHSSSSLAILHDFSKNQFTGPVPPMLIASNRIAGQPSYGFWFNGNNLEGNMSVYSFDLCQNLESLIFDIGNNRITGELPSGMGSRCKCMKHLDFAGNKLVGKIPLSFAYLDSLVNLDLSGNKLQGLIPSYFARMKDLRYLSLSRNNFTGEIPRDLAQLTSLEVLELSSNSLSGEIPPNFAGLEHLTILQLDHNHLSGQIPANYGNRTSLLVFNVSFNNLSGSVPLNSNSIKCEDIQGNPNLQPCHTNPSSAAWEQQHSGNASQPPYNTTGGAPRHGNMFNSIEIASIISASCIVFVLICLIFLLVCMRKFIPRSASGQGASGRKEVVTCNNIGVQLTYENVVRATGSFNGQNCIGSGGFGATYKAEITPGVVVAVKRLSVGRFQGVQQFAAEIRTLGRVQHPNLVTLIGYHVSETEMFLIYNYLPGGNLEKFIQERSKRSVEWSMLHKIALDIARALAYLHDECVPRVLHRDIKPSNILLDNNFNAYLSDFGLARLLGTSETHATTDVAGTFGYVAPEYAMTCRVSDKADVYSYGIVLLELISDKKALDPSFSSYGNGFNIVAWALMLLQQGRASEFFIAGLWDSGPHDDLIETLHLAVRCTVESLSTRPSMKQVAQRLKRIQPPTC